MRKLATIAIIALFVFASATPAFCENNAFTKLGRGFANMISCPLEVPEQMSRTNNTDGIFAGSTVGLLKGIGMTVGRACVGMYEVATFLIPYPNNFEPILKDPEYFFENSNF